MDEKIKRPEAKIYTVTGKYIDLFHLTPDDISIVDIIYGLASRARFCGQTTWPYSVALHSVHVSERLRDDGHSPLVQLAGLMHDAHEAYMVDMPTPLKRWFPEFKLLEDRVQSVIDHAFGIDRLTVGEKLAVAKADEDELEYEQVVVRTKFCPLTSVFEDREMFRQKFITLSTTLMKRA